MIITKLTMSYCPREGQYCLTHVKPRTFYFELNQNGFCKLCWLYFLYMEHFLTHHHHVKSLHCFNFNTKNFYVSLKYTSRLNFDLKMEKIFLTLVFISTWRKSTILPPTIYLSNKHIKKPIHQSTEHDDIGFLSPLKLFVWRTYINSWWSKSLWYKTCLSYSKRGDHHLNFYCCEKKKQYIW